MTTVTDPRTARAAEIDAVSSRPWRLVIDGQLRAAGGGATFTTSDPFTERPLAQVPNAGTEDVDAAVAAAASAQAAWRAVPVLERSRLVLQLADKIEEHSEELALLDTLD
ncbi:aldehyde dehydrogenase family protein, partial [Mycobacteroides abscessus subsp. abscessus]